MSRAAGRPDPRSAGPRPPRRRLLGLALAGIVLSSGMASAQSPGSLRLVVPYAPGGVGDLLARTLAERVTAAGGPRVLVDNRPGGGTVIGAQSVLQAPADGQTLLLVAASFVINAHLLARPPFDPLKDFAPVTLLGSNPHLLVVHPAVPATDLRSFLAWARERQGAATFASFGNGSSGHLAFALLARRAGIAMAHVPYKGGGPAMQDLVAGQVDAMLTDLPQAVPLVKAGKLRAIALAQRTRDETLPATPTMDEAGLQGFESRSWYGLVARAGTPPDIVARLNAAFVAALREPGVRAKLEQAGLDLAGTSAPAFAEFLDAESARYAEAVRVSGARLD